MQSQGIIKDEGLELSCASVQNGLEQKKIVDHGNWDMGKDRLFAGKKKKKEPFSFNREVAEVFDDMLYRSVPLYGESLHRQAQIVSTYYQEKTRIYDLGCSNGNLGISILDQMKGRTFSLIGVDSSRPMIEIYAKKLKDRQDSFSVRLVCGLLEDIKIDNASVVLINLTLQFIDPKNRDEVINKIFQGLKPGGLLILTEKTIHHESEINALQLQFYKQFKLENGYSELEISQKREALEKVLIPDTVHAHENRLKQAGFKIIEPWLKWFNFVSFLAVKE